MSRRRPVAVPPRVVLDMPWLLHALLLSDPAAQALRRGWQEGRFRPLVCARSARLLARALSHGPLGLDAGQQQELLADFLPYAEVVVGESAQRVPGLNPELQLLVQLALRGQAQVLLSDREALWQWQATSRSAAARQLCTVQTVPSFLTAFVLGGA